VLQFVRPRQRRQDRGVDRHASPGQKHQAEDQEMFAPHECWASAQNANRLQASIRHTTINIGRHPI
jgi:hypothetical protein